MLRNRAAALMLALGTLGALGATACARTPTMRLHHAELRSASFAGVNLDVVLRVHNPNSYDVRIRNVRVRVRIEDRYDMPPVQYSPNQWLPAGEDTLVRAPVLIPYALIPQLLRETVRSPVIRYRAQGNADVTAVRLLGIERDNVPVNEEGAVDRLALIAASGINISF
ncbi:MAG TPA: LEA type 2 family protein [Candidatus Nanopelagicales bacterium]|nr:LEA type 2 family protein [Candidatus Nanopelagicales bacterium]